MEESAGTHWRWCEERLGKKSPIDHGSLPSPLSNAWKGEAISDAGSKQRERGYAPETAVDAEIDINSLVQWSV